MNNSNSDRYRVLMLGDSLKQTGGIATVENLIINYAPANFQMQHITSHDEGSIAYRVWVFAKALVLLLTKLIRNQVDLVHIHVSDGGSILRKAIIAAIAFLFRKPVVMHAHGSVFHLNYAKLPPLLQSWLRWVFQRCDAFIALTSYWRDYYASTLELDAQRVWVVHNPSELPDQVPDRRHADPVRFAFCGRIGQRKGAFDCIRAFAKLPTHLRAELLMAGDGEVEQAKQLVESLNLSERVTLLGWISPQQRDALLEKSAVLVLPTYNEGLPLALLEAMGRGLPVLTTPTSGIPDVVTSGKNGLLVPPGDIQQLADAMQLLIEDETLRLSLGKAARGTAESLDVKSFWVRLAELYRSVLTSDSHPQRAEKSPVEVLR